MSRLSGWALGGSALLTLLAGLMIGLAAPIRAQGPGLAIDQASLRLWPEYDDPGLLVILSGSITGTTTFPQRVAFPIPTGARGIQATFADAAGDLYNQPWQIVDGKLVYELPGPTFQLEYYLDRPVSGDQREIDYTFEAPYPIRRLELAVQQPARANAFAVTPPAQRTVQGADGFTSYLVERNSLSAGEKLPVSIRYTKGDQGLSVAQARIDGGGAGASSPATEPLARRSTDWLPIALIGLGVVMLAGAGMVWFWRIRPASPAPPVTAQPAGKPAQTPQKARSAPAAFCTQCGRQLGAADRFCAQCGAPRKS